MKIEGCIGLACNDILLLLSKDRDGSTSIKGFEYTLPAARGTGLQVYVDAIEKFNHSPDQPIEDIFQFNTFGYSFGARCTDDKLVFFKLKESLCISHVSSIESSITPSYDCISSTLLTYSLLSGSINTISCYMNSFQLAFKSKDKISCFVSLLP